MRIAILGSRGYPSTYGGFETLVRRLAPWLVANGHSVTVYGRAPARQYSEMIDGVHVIHTIGLDAKATSTASHGLSAAWHCVRNPPDVVLALNIANGPAAVLLRARRIPVVMNVDGIEWERAKWGHLAKAWFRMGAWLSAKTAHILADSQEIARIWNQRYRVDPVYIPYGADMLQPGYQRLRALGIQPTRYALVVARLVPENNVELFLDAMDILGWPTPVVVVGNANYNNPITKRLTVLNELGLLRWLGHVSDQELLAELWANAALYFHGHSVGGTNPALLSAMALGAPTIAIDTPFNREVIGSSAVVEPTPAAVAARVKHLLHNPVAQAEAADSARERIQAGYQWPDVLKRYEALLMRVSSGDRQRVSK